MVRLPDRLLYNRLVGRAVLSPATAWGFRRFRATGTTPRAAYSAMRKLFGNDDDQLFERLYERLLGAPEQGAAPDVVPGSPRVSGVAAEEIARAVAGLERDGFVVLDRRLDAPDCDELERSARQSLCSLVGPSGPLPERRRFADATTTAIRWDLDEEDILHTEAAQRLVADESLLEVARRYLKAPPVQDLVAMWWSTPVVGTAQGSSAAAQQFHFDLDRLRFLKVFVFLTDVDERTGPHVYVRGSHRGLDRRFRRDGRHADDEVTAAFGDDVRLITGPRGTVFLADTRGLHKGLALETGHRLVFQTEYAVSLFGSSYRKPVVDPIPELELMVRRFPDVFARFVLRGASRLPSEVSE